MLGYGPGWDPPKGTEGDDESAHQVPFYQYWRPQLQFHKRGANIKVGLSDRSRKLQAVSLISVLRKVMEQIILRVMRCYM